MGTSSVSNDVPAGERLTKVRGINAALLGPSAIVPPRGPLVTPHGRESAGGGRCSGYRRLLKRGYGCGVTSRLAK